MKKIIGFLLLIVLSFSVDANAMTVTIGGVTYDAGSNWSDSGTCYSTLLFTVTLTPASGGVYTVDFAKNDVFPDAVDTVEVTAAQFNTALASKYGLPNGTYENWYSGGLNVVANGTIAIFVNGEQKELITSAAQVDSIAGTKYGFGPGDCADMRARFDIGLVSTTPPPEENVSNNLKAISYVGDTKVLSTNKYIKVGLKVDNSFTTTFLNEDYTVRFNGNTYKFNRDVSNGTGDYITYDIPNPQPAVATSYNVRVTVNADNKNPVETNTNDNYKDAIIQIYPPVTPPPPDNKTFDLELKLNGALGETTTKAGYGIGLEVNIKEFTHTLVNNPTQDDCKANPGGTAPSSSTTIRAIEGETGFRNFDLKNGSIKIIAKNFSFSTTPFGEQITELTIPYNSIGGEQANFIGKIYTNPSLPDSNGSQKYEFVVHFEGQPAWEELVEWWNPHKSGPYIDSSSCSHYNHRGCMSSSCSEGYTHNHYYREWCDYHNRSHRYFDYSDYRCGHTHIDHTHVDGDICITNDRHPDGCYYWTGGWEQKWIAADLASYNFKEEFFKQELEGSIIIKGSMYDDDDVIINK